MIRLLGVITGSALAIAALLLFIGVPQFRSEAVQAERQPVRLPRQTQPVEQATPVHEPVNEPVHEPMHDPVHESAALARDGDVEDTEHTERETAAPAAAVAVSDPPASPDGVADSAAGENIPPPAAVRRPAEPDGWYVFWSPFSSRIAAEGFVARLQSVTGLDFRIVRRKPGAYEVSFSYADDDDIHRHLSQISAATGLDLPESP